MGHEVAREGFEVAAGAVEEDNIGALARYESPGRHARGLDRPHLEVDAGQVGPHGHSCPPEFTGWDGELFGLARTGPMLARGGSAGVKVATAMPVSHSGMAE